MMVETVLECSQDFGMSNGSLPQWKRELLQRRAARGRGTPPAPPAPPAPPLPPAPPDEDEELRYGPGIVKRLKSRYLSLALRDAPRRRPSVLRRAASLEHLLDERPPRAPRPASLAAPVPRAPSRRDAVKRARSVDALSRLESRDEPVLPEPREILPSRAPAVSSEPPPPRAPRPPRRPAPLLRDTERPPPDVVRSALRKFESAPPRRAAPAARVSAVLRGLEGRRSTTPENDQPTIQREPGPPIDPPPPPPESSPPKSPSPAPVSVLPPSPSPPTRPAPAIPTTPVPKIIAPIQQSTVVPSKAVPSLQTPAPGEPISKSPEPVSPRPASPISPIATVTNQEECELGSVRAVSRAALEGIARAGSSVRFAFEAPRAGSHLPPLAATNPVLVARRVGVIRPMPAPRRSASPPLKRSTSPPPEEDRPKVNGHSTPEPRALSRIGAAGIERAWSGSPAGPAAWARGGGRARAPPPAATSVVFNFSNRKEVPDYIENDGIILRANRRNMIKAGEAGVVVLRPEALQLPSDSEEEPDGGPPSPCSVRFTNAGVLINGRSSMPARPQRDPTRIARLKLQFDESLTRTFEYPSETSLCEDLPGEPRAASPAPPAPPAPTAPQPAAPAPLLVQNTHIASAVLSRYTPSKTAAGAFQLGVAAPAPPLTTTTTTTTTINSHTGVEGVPGAVAVVEGGEGCAHAVPCGADAARAWSDARLTTDLLF